VRFACLEASLAGSRLYADNKTLGARVKVHREINDMFKRLFGRVPDRWLFNYAHVVWSSVPFYRSQCKNVCCSSWSHFALSALRWNWRVSAAMRKTVFMDFCQRKPENLLTGTYTDGWADPASTYKLSHRKSTNP